MQPISTRECHAAKHPGLDRCFSAASILVFCCVSAAIAEDAKSYPRKDLLIEVADLAKTQNDKRQILDTRDKDKYLAGHIPGAVWVDGTAWGKAVTDDRDAASWSRRFADLGLNDDTEVVVYDDQRLRGAARVWWILRLWGVERPRVLNGGWDAYVESGGPIEKGAGTAPKTGSATARLRSNVLATKDLLLTAHRDGRLGKAGRDSLQVIDTRSTAEFCGTDATRAKRVGTIPGAKHLEWSDLLVTGTARLKSRDDLQKLFAEKGIDVQQPAATFCQGGGRAAVMAFGLEVMGSPEARNYYASWGEWGNAEDTPVEIPKTP